MDFYKYVLTLDERQRRYIRQMLYDHVQMLRQDYDMANIPKELEDLRHNLNFVCELQRSADLASHNRMVAEAKASTANGIITFLNDLTNQLYTR